MGGELAYQAALFFLHSGTCHIIIAFPKVFTNKTGLVAFEYIRCLWHVAEALPVFSPYLGTREVVTHEHTGLDPPGNPARRLGELDANKDTKGVVKIMTDRDAGFLAGPGRGTSLRIGELRAAATRFNKRAMSVATVESQRQGHG